MTPEAMSGYEFEYTEIRDLTGEVIHRVPTSLVRLERGEFVLTPAMAAGIGMKFAEGGFITPGAEAASLPDDDDYPTPPLVW